MTVAVDSAASPLVCTEDAAQKWAQKRVQLAWAAGQSRRRGLPRPFWLVDPRSHGRTPVGGAGGWLRRGINLVTGGHPAQPPGPVLSAQCHSDVPSSGAASLPAGPSLLPGGRGPSPSSVPEASAVAGVCLGDTKQSRDGRILLFCCGLRDSQAAKWITF